MRRSSVAGAASDAELARSIEAGARDLSLALPDASVGRLVAYVRLLEHWNTTYNLTAIRDPVAIVVQHVLDCLAAAASLTRHRAQDATRRLLDVGSGAGLPGLVMAAVFPGVQVLCVDKVAKKTAFITQAGASLALRNLAARQIAVETMEAPGFDVITSRALGRLRDLVKGSRHLLAEGGEWMAMKGKVPSSEINELAGVEVLVETLRVPRLDADRCIVWMSPKCK